MLRAACGNVRSKYDQIRLFTDSNAAQPVVAQELICLVDGGRLDHLLDGDALAGILQGIQTAGKLTDHAFLHTDQRISRVDDGVVAGGGHHDTRVEEGLHGELVRSALLAYIGHDHGVEFGRLVEPVRVGDRHDAQLRHAGNVRLVNDLQMGDGVPIIMRSGLGQRPLDGVQRHGQCAIADGVDVHREAELVGPLEHRRQGLHVEAQLPAILMLLRPGIGVGLLHIGGGGIARKTTVELDLDVAHFKHGALRPNPELCGVLDLRHGVMTLGLEYLIGSIDVHFELALHIQFVAGLRRVVGAVPVDDGIQDQGFSMRQIFLLIIQEALLVLFHCENGERLQ